MFSAGRILRQNRRLSSLPAGAAVTARPRKEKRKFRCYMPFMWSALAMSFFGITVIVTGTAMCVAGWYLGHFGADELITKTVVQSSNGTAVIGQPASLLGISVDMPPARGLAYAGPVVMSFGCFAVVFACVVVCETRDRVLETMDERVRRGLPARPPGGIDANFYTLVVEFRKRRVEKQRRGRKLLRSDDDNDMEEPQVEYLTSPLQPTSPTGNLQSPSTTHDVMEDRSDHVPPIVDQYLPTVRLEEPEVISDERHEQLATLWCSNPSFSDQPCSSSCDVELRTMVQCTSAGSTQAPDQSTVSNLSPSWKPAATSTSAQSCLSAGHSTCSESPWEHDAAVPSTTVEDRSHVTTSQLSFPLLAPISSMTRTQVLPYVRLEGQSTLPTYFIHTAAVHAIADRSPDSLPQPDMTSFEFPPTADLPHSGDSTTSGRAIASDDVSGKWNSESCLVGDANLAGACHVTSATDSVTPRQLWSHDDDKLSDGHATQRSCSSEALSGSFVDCVPPAVDVIKRRHYSPSSDHKQSPVTDRLASWDDYPDKCPGWSSRSVDDGEPSTKRSRGSADHQPRQVLGGPVPVDGHGTPLSGSMNFGVSAANCPQPSNACFSTASPYLIGSRSVTGTEILGGGSMYWPPGQDGTNPVYARRRRQNVNRQAVTTQRRPGRLDREDYSVSGVATPRQNFELDAAHCGDDELEQFLSATSSVEENGNRATRDVDVTTIDDENSQLIWLRRRTNTTSPQRPHRRTSDPFQATV